MLINQVGQYLIYIWNNWILELFIDFQACKDIARTKILLKTSQESLLLYIPKSKKI